MDGARLSVVTSATVAVIALLVSGYAIVNANQKPTVTNTLSVSGIGSLLVTPDQLVINLGVQMEGKTATDALAANSQLMNQTVAALKNDGLNNSELSTSNFNIQPLYFYPKNSSGIITGYQATNTITVTTGKTAMAGHYIDTAVSSGTNQVNFVYFTVSDSLQARARGQLLATASEDAQTKATSALSPLGMKIVGVQSMSVSESGLPINARTDVSASTPILPSQQKVTVTVQVTFLIGPK